MHKNHVRTMRRNTTEPEQSTTKNFTLLDIKPAWNWRNSCFKFYSL